MLVRPCSRGHAVTRLDRRELILHSSCRDCSGGQRGDGGRGGPGSLLHFPWYRVLPLRVSCCWSGGDAELAGSHEAGRSRPLSAEAASFRGVLALQPCGGVPGSLSARTTSCLMAWLARPAAGSHVSSTVVAVKQDWFVGLDGCCGAGGTCWEPVQAAGAPPGPSGERRLEEGVCGLGWVCIMRWVLCWSISPLPFSTLWKEVPASLLTQVFVWKKM